MNTELVLQLFADWYARRSGEFPAIIESSEPALHRLSARLGAGNRRLQLEAGVLYADLLTPPFESRLRLFESEVGRGLPGGYLLWLPPGAEIPVDTADLSPLVTAIRDAARAMTPGELRDLALPVTLHLRKTAEQGAYITVTGGLSDHWSQVSQHVQGVYQLDSRPIKRLPREEGFVPELTEQIAMLSRTMQVGEWSDIGSADNWTLQRLSAGTGLGVMAAPPLFDPGDGTFVRRALRHLVRDLGGRLAAADADLRVLLIVSAHRHIGEENIGPSLVGFDPALYTPIDLLVLAADGEVKAILAER